MKSTNKTKQDPKLYKDFPITSICRADLESAGFNTKNVDDGTMSELASKMADAYCEFVFWIDLEILADFLKIKKHKKSK
jgi:hypothetical protein